MSESLPPAVERLAKTQTNELSSALNVAEHAEADRVLINPTDETVCSLKSGIPVPIMKRGIYHCYLPHMAELHGFYKTLTVHPYDSTRLQVHAVIKTEDSDTPFIINASEFNEDSGLLNMPTNRQLQDMFERGIRRTDFDTKERREIFDWAAARNTLRMQDITGQKRLVDMDKFQVGQLVGQIIKDENAIPFKNKIGN